jgi:transcriptional regulator with XRE-family HTH domain
MSKFGRTIRRLREERNLSIADFARKVGISPTYLAPIERDVFPPPAEPKVVRIAKALDQDPDELLALAGRIGTDLRRIIRRRPRHAARLLRAIDHLPEEEIEALVSAAQKKNHRRGRSRRGTSSSVSP